MADSFAASGARVVDWKAIFESEYPLNFHAVRIPRYFGRNVPHDGKREERNRDS
jgi:hypothetical protein